MLARYGTPARMLEAGRALYGRPGGPRQAIEALSHPDWAAIERDLRWLESGKRTLLTLADQRYPPLLREIFAPPGVLFVEGDPALLHRAQVAVVGSRRASGYGRRLARRLSRELAAAGLAVTSGLARGIDGCAHWGALEGGGVTLAVAGTGPDRVYPRAHRELACRIASQGAVLSEFPRGTPPWPGNFPRRNRIISGLSAGVLVVEATVDSGSLITARHALDQGRDVFAVPGAVTNPLSRGCHSLIQQGAKLVATVSDVLEEIGGSFATGRAVSPGPPAPSLPPGLPPGLRRLLECFDEESVSVDTLVGKSGLTPAEVSSMLFTLELKNCVRVGLDGNYQRLK
ncbi:MAG: DNA-processing protein DprA [Gammaproteobacteria bacterium]|nr:DNA-processing protein DprA [Gammaproteobacteria bacterium]